MPRGNPEGVTIGFDVTNLNDEAKARVRGKLRDALKAELKTDALRKLEAAAGHSSIHSSVTDELMRDVL